MKKDFIRVFCMKKDFNKELYVRFRTALSLDSKDKVFSIPHSFLAIKHVR